MEDIEDQKGREMIAEEILIEIDETLDRLIQNAEAIEKVELKDLNESELQAFEKTQESLLQHLLHMDQFLVMKKESLKKPNQKSAGLKIQEKLFKFHALDTNYQKNAAKIAYKLPIRAKRRSKRQLQHAFLEKVYS